MPGNFSSSQLSAITASVLALLTAVAFYFLHQDWKLAAISFGVLFVVTYSMIIYLVNRYIDRKIKLIYKFIYQTKANKREETFYKYVLPRKTIDEVREDVEKWAAQRTDEIEVLKSNEAFRKEFLQNLSHEFKTPVFAIQGYVDTLLAGALENPAVNTRFLENASRNVDRLVHLLNDLDEISELESGRLPVVKKGFIIQDLVKEVYETLSIKGIEKNIRMQLKKGSEQPVTVFADQEKIRQVIINLVTNAIKYGKDNGHVTTSVYKIEGRKVLMEVSDDGIGIAEEHLPRIFERFYRTDTGRSRNVGGTGLGLAICKHIVEAHGQTIHVRSKTDVGTTIGFTLDLKP
jgi:two-component system, OmpR family, phosphate regulon sensor histidine kinase PhoR